MRGQLLKLKRIALEKDKFDAIEKYINDLVTYQTPTQLTDQATINWDITKYYNVYVTLAGSRTLNIQGAQKGDYGTIKIIQGGSGSYTLTLPSTSKVANTGAGALTLSTGVGQYDIASFYVDENGVFNWTYSPDFT